MLRLYMDVHVPRSITVGLHMRGVDVMTAQSDGAATWTDDRPLQRATELARVLFSQDSDLLREAARLQEQGLPFSGLIYAHQQAASIGTLIDDLFLAVSVARPEDFHNKVLFLPL